MRLSSTQHETVDLLACRVAVLVEPDLLNHPRPYNLDLGHYMDHVAFFISFPGEVESSGCW